MIDSYYKEVSMFTMLLLLEIELFKEFLQTKDNNYSEDGELHLVKITKNDYDYSYCNFLTEKVRFNRENPNINKYLQDYEDLVAKLTEIVKLVLGKMHINIDEIETYDYLQNCMKNFYASSVEKYFFFIFEYGMEYFLKQKYNDAFNEMMIGKYYFEILIFIRMISSSKSSTIDFFKLFQCVEDEDELNLLTETKIKNIPSNVNNLVMFTFLGGIIKEFKSQKIIEEDLTSQSTVNCSEDAKDSLINFYPEIITILIESAKFK